MALIPKSQYKGETKGRKIITLDKIADTPFWTNSNKIVIRVQRHWWSKNEKKWVETYSQTWDFRDIESAIKYIQQYMLKKGYTPTYNIQESREFEMPDGTIKTVARTIHHTLVRNDKDQLCYYSRWTKKENNYLIQHTFLQLKTEPRQYRDYHDPVQPQWSHKETVTRYDPETGKTTTRQIRTYLDTDEEDTTLQRNRAYWRQKRAIQREYDDYTRDSLNMTPQEYRQFKHDMIHMTDQEWHDKYGVDHSYFND